MAVTLKEKRIEFRIPNEDKQLLECAANSCGLSLSSYIISVCLKQAKMDLERNETIVLKEKERDILIRALSEPAKPNKALKDLLK